MAMTLLHVFTITALALVTFGWTVLIWLATAPLRWERAERKRMEAELKDWAANDRPSTTKGGRS